MTLKFLHENNVIHRDISLLNVLYSKKLNEIRLIDFGIAKKLSAEDILMTPTGNQIFLAPEIK